MPIFAFGHFELDTDRHVLLADGRPTGIKGRPIQILGALVSKAGETVTPDEILSEVWRGVVVGENNLPVQMSILRRGLRAHGAEDWIVTLPDHAGYRFTAPVRAARMREDAAVAAPERRARPVGLWVGAGTAAWALLGMGVWLGPAPARFVAHVQVEARPDTIAMVPGGFGRVDYVFHVSDAVELQLASEDVRFNLVSGEPVSAASVRGRIYQGSFPISGPGSGVYHNNIYLPAAVAEAVRANGQRDVYLRHVFHLSDPRGAEVDVPAVLRITVAD